MTSPSSPLQVWSSTQEPAGYGIEFMGYLLPELYLDEAQAQTTLAVRAASYADGEHRKVVPLYRAPASQERQK